MTAADLEAFRARMRWTRSRLGSELDVSQKRLRRLLDGLQPIPRHIALACAALSYGLPPLASQ
jgi:hypothetical protein